MAAVIYLIALSMLLHQSLTVTLVAAAQPDEPPPLPAAAADPPPLRPLADWTAALLAHTPRAADGTHTAPRMLRRDGEKDSSRQCRWCGPRSLRPSVRLPAADLPAAESEIGRVRLPRWPPRETMLEDQSAHE